MFLSNSVDVMKNLLEGQTYHIQVWGFCTFWGDLAYCEPCQAELKAGRSGKPVTWGLKTRKKNYGKWNTYFYALEHEVPTLCYITWSVLIVFIMILFRIEIGMRSHSIFFPKLQAEVQKTWNLFRFLKFRYYEKATKISYIFHFLFDITKGQ